MRTRLFLLAALTSLALVGCGGSGSGDGSNQTNRTVPPFIPKGDDQYVDAIVPHHQQATAMAQIEVSKGTRADVKAMAQSMIDSQTAQIQQLSTIHGQITGTEVVPTWKDPHVEADIANLQSLSGSAVDTTFLTEMISHHATAINFAHRAMPTLTREDVISNAQMVYTVQAQEIGQMINMLQSGG